MDESDMIAVAVQVEKISQEASVNLCRNDSNDECLVANTGSYFGSSVLVNKR